MEQRCLPILSQRQPEISPSGRRLCQRARHRIGGSNRHNLPAYDRQGWQARTLPLRRRGCFPGPRWRTLFLDSRLPSRQGRGGKEERMMFFSNSAALLHGLIFYYNLYD